MSPPTTNQKNYNVKTRIYIMFFRVQLPFYFSQDLSYLKNLILYINLFSNNLTTSVVSFGKNNNEDYTLKLICSMYIKIAKRTWSTGLLVEFILPIST